MRKGGKGMGLTTDHNGNLIQISKRGIKFTGMAQPKIRMVAIDKAKRKLV